MKEYACCIILVFTSLFITHVAYSQEALEPRPSPMAAVTTQQGGTYVKVVYSRPHKRGRKIFGSELAPYGKVWRFGANEATEITITKDIKVCGKPLKAGTYSLYAIPREEKDWTIIFNKALGQWGAFNYDQSKDALRVKVLPQHSDITYEPLTITFSEEGNAMIMTWDTTKVVIPITL